MLASYICTHVRRTVALARQGVRRMRVRVCLRERASVRLETSGHVGPRGAASKRQAISPLHAPTHVSAQRRSRSYATDVRATLYDGEYQHKHTVTHAHTQTLFYIWSALLRNHEA